MLNVWMILSGILFTEFFTYSVSQYLTERVRLVDSWWKHFHTKSRKKLQPSKCKSA